MTAEEPEMTDEKPEEWDGQNEGYGACGVLGCKDCY